MENQDNQTTVTSELKPQAEKPAKKRYGGLVGGSILVVVGLIWLLQNYFPQINFKLLGPAILVIVGLWLLLKSSRQ